MALAEEAMRELESLGTIEFIIVPQPLAPARCQSLCHPVIRTRVIAPSGGKKKVSEVIDPHGGNELLPSDDTISLVEFTATQGDEFVMVVRSPSGGTTLVFTDAVFNMPHLPGAQGSSSSTSRSRVGPPRVAHCAHVSD